VCVVAGRQRSRTSPESVSIPSYVCGTKKDIRPYTMEIIWMAKKITLNLEKNSAPFQLMARRRKLHPVPIPRISQSSSPWKQLSSGEAEWHTGNQVVWISVAKPTYREGKIEFIIGLDMAQRTATRQW